MTKLQILCLTFLSGPRMEANVTQIGEHIRSATGATHYIETRNAARVVVGTLRGAGLVTYLPDLRAWRITKAGRDRLI